MSRSQRLLQLIQCLRSHAPPLRAQTLADELGVSVRSIYRDIDTLRGSGAVIDGAAGVGYTLVEDPALPPMMFSQDEMEALVLGLGEVRAVGDPVLSRAARDALGKLKACLPDSRRRQLEHSVLHVRRFHERPKITVDVAELRAAAREETAVDIRYSDEKGARTARRVLPLSIVFMDQVLVLLAWCQLRRDYRAFRVDRIRRLQVSDESFRPRRVAMNREFVARLKRYNEENP